MRTYTADVKDHIGKTITVKGFAQEVRDLKNIKFILLRDITGTVQAIALKKLTDPKSFELISKTNVESSVTITGKVEKSDQAKQGYELKIKTLEILNNAEVPLPIDFSGKINTGLDKRLDWRHLDLRNPKHLLIFKIDTEMEAAMREYWLANDFIEIHTPKFMSAPSESGAELFSVEYFGKTAYLAQSPQFYKQMAMAAGFEKIFEIAPVFRANPSHTTRHDTEFTMVDTEISYIDSVEDIMQFEEKWIQFTLKKLKQKFGKEIKQTFGVEIVVPQIPFPRLTMPETLKMLKKKGYKNTTGDLDAEGEKLLYEIIKKKYKHEFIFVTEYPVHIRPFYHMYSDDKKTTKSYDLIWKGVEITTGAQREHRYKILKQQALDKGLHEGPIKDYLSFFKYGCPPHGGFGLSPTRLLMLMLNLGNVREATFLPRDTDRLTP